MREGVRAEEPTRVVLQGALLVGGLELGLGGVWRHPEDVIELCFSHHGGGCWVGAIRVAVGKFLLRLSAGWMVQSRVRCLLAGIVKDRCAEPVGEEK